MKHQRRPGRMTGPPARHTGPLEGTRKRADAGDGLQSLQTTFRILDELANAQGPVGVSELARTLGELKPRVYRHLSTLKGLGAVFQDAKSGGYSLGSRLFSLGEAALEQFDLR